MLKKSDTIAVTGATGLVGAHLIQRLISEGYNNVIALKRPKSRMDICRPFSDKVEWVTGDLDDVNILRHLADTSHTFIHCAAMISMDDADRNKMNHINVHGTANVVNACMEGNVERLIYVSSVAALGRPITDGLINEDSKWEVNSLTSAYARSKRNADLEVWRGEAEGLGVSTIRPSLILGSGYWEDGTGRMFKTCADGLPFYPAGGTGVVDVRDVVDLILALANADESGIDIIANGHNPSFIKLQTMICHHLDTKPPKYKLSKFLSEIGWRAEKAKSILTGKKSILTKSSVRRAMKHFYYDNSRSKERFGFEYRPLEKTIAELVEKYMEFMQDGSVGVLK